MTAVPSNRTRSVLSLQWTPMADQRLVGMRHDGSSLRAIARAFGLSRASITGRARNLGLDIPTKPGPMQKPEPLELDRAREPLPAGHPISWGLLTEGTVLQGSPYTPPSHARTRMAGRGELA